MLKVVASASGAKDVQALQEEVAFGHQCGLCHPYVRRMLRTGTTVFHQIITEEDEPVVEDVTPGRGTDDNDCVTSRSG